LELWHSKELAKLKSRIAMRNADDARRAAVEARETYLYTAEIACASARRVPPPPMSPVACPLPSRPISSVPDALAEDVVDGDGVGNEDVPMQFKDSDEFVEEGPNGVLNLKVHLQSQMFTPTVGIPKGLSFMVQQHSSRFTVLKTQPEQLEHFQNALG
jgi:hypothetical protein